MITLSRDVPRSGRLETMVNKRFRIRFYGVSNFINCQLYRGEFKVVCIVTERFT